jgi:hypothetical protein
MYMPEYPVPVKAFAGIVQLDDHGKYWLQIPVNG